LKPRTLRLSPRERIKRLVEGVEYDVGSKVLVNELGLNVEDERIHKLGEQDKTLVFLDSREKVIGVIALADTVREESRRAVQALKRWE